MRYTGSRSRLSFRSAVAILLTGGTLLNCTPPGEISGPPSESYQEYTLFSEFSIKKGSDADRSFIALRGVRMEEGVLELQATSWGIRETGLFLMRSRAPRTATFLFIGDCGTVSSYTWEKTTILYALTPADQDTLERILFTSHLDTLEIVRTHTTRVAPPGLEWNAATPTTVR